MKKGMTVPVFDAKTAKPFIRLVCWCLKYAKIELVEAMLEEGLKDKNRIWGKDDAIRNPRRFLAESKLAEYASECGEAGPRETGGQNEVEPGVWAPVWSDGKCRLDGATYAREGEGWVRE